MRCFVPAQPRPTRGNSSTETAVVIIHVTFYFNLESVDEDPSNIILATTNETTAAVV
eukprot:CAMPEP_0198144826 /NCGR_PEP_ID=MMETSP1443-20131203/18694_1 /TAXON_ID=186043 /ORGANISM="Entomoneis sp., Strain CCMP2396" /LENGTH=56 /DNA_ID=CAMNT_0043808291 /DNA_START=45 /DNA_END=215 /DNA_ORIENTATION=+